MSDLFDLKLVPDSPHRLDVAIRVGLGFDLAAEPLDVDIDRPVVAEVIKAPDKLEELRPGECAILMGRQVPKEVELFGV